MELDSGFNVKKTYVYTNGQIIMQHNGDSSADKYFYLHDRLGSVRQVIDDEAKQGSKVVYAVHTNWFVKVIIIQSFG